MNIKKTLLINKIIERKNQDISWEQAVNFTVKNESEENVKALSEEAKNVFLERLQQDQYIHSLS
jgi:hypothetical protein